MFNLFKSEGPKAANAAAYLPSDEEVQAAQKKIEADLRLSENPRVQDMVENGFMKEDGTYVDPVSFVDSMTKFLDSQSIASESDIPLTQYFVDKDGLVQSSNPRVASDTPATPM